MMREYVHNPFSVHPNRAFFITYYGDVYFGNLSSLGHNEAPLYIIEPRNYNRWRALKSNERTPEVMRELGWEIPDPKIIKYYIPEEEMPDKVGRGQSLGFMGKTRKRMFLFGAGASAYCVFGKNKQNFETFGKRPPLGCDMFDERFEELCNKYPAVKIALPGYESSGNDIEAFLQSEWQEIRTGFHPRKLARHSNIQYYMHELFKGISNDVNNRFSRGNLYSLFCNKIESHLTKHENELVSLVSFNYDTILEHNINLVFNLGFNNMDDYIDIQNRQLLLFKPHGSSNWAWQFPDGIGRITDNLTVKDYLYKNSVDLSELYYKLLGPIEQTISLQSYGYESYLHEHGLGRYTLDKDLIGIINDYSKPYYPAMLLPYRDKDEFVMPYRHQTMFRALIHDLEELHLVGWKGNEAVFNRQIANANKLKRVVVVNPEPSEVRQNLLKYLDGKEIEWIEVPNFEDYVCKQLDGLLQAKTAAA